jgi:hypothetical protein
MGDDRNQLFPLPEWLSFGETPWVGRTLFPMTSKYTKDYASQQMPRTPATTVLVSTNETHAALGYMTQESITSSLEQISHHCQAPLPCSTRPALTLGPLRPDIISSTKWCIVLHPVTPCLRLLCHTSSPRSPTSHPQEMPHMAHGPPNLAQDRPSSMGGMGMRGPSFRTGSLSHSCDPSQQAPHSS